MNKSKLKSYAPQARRDFITAVSARAATFALPPDESTKVEVSGDVAIINGNAYPRSVATFRQRLLDRIKAEGWEQFVEEIAYTWFNRFTALRFMEVNGFLPHGLRVLSNPDESKNEPEILEKAHTIDLPGLDRERVVELKLAANKESELYRSLLVAQCNQLHVAMPFLFERINDETELLLPDNLLHSDSVIRKLLQEIDEDDWRQIEIIGWLYESYISKRKAEVIGRVVKSEDIPAATQLFTPNWIVKYMTHNSLGRLWLQTYTDSDLRSKMEYYIEPAEQSEEVKSELAKLTPASINPEEIKILDPACGSGHILVEAYDLLKEIYQERGYSNRDIPRLILEKNLYGLDIDERAAQLASFSVLMKARGDDHRIVSTGTPQLNIIAIPESAHLNYKELADALLTRHETAPGMPIRGEAMLLDVDKQPSLSVTVGLAEMAPDVVRSSAAQIGELLQLFTNGKTFGSLITIPTSIVDVLEELENLVRTRKASNELMQRAAAEEIAPFVCAARILSRKYDCVMANPPYMGSNFFNPLLKQFVKNKYATSKSDLYASFIVRNLEFCKPRGHVAMLTIPNWMFLSNFKNLRDELLTNFVIQSLIHNGRGVFGSDFGTCAFVIAKETDRNRRGSFKRLFDIQGSVANNEELRGRFFRKDIFHASSTDFLRIPGHPIAYWLSDRMRDAYKDADLLSTITETRIGLITGDNTRYIRYWQEVNFCEIGFNKDRESAKQSGLPWFPQMKGGEYRKWYGNHETVVFWKDDGHILQTTMHPTSDRIFAHNFNLDKIFKPGLTWTKISSSLFGVRLQPKGFLFNDASASAFPREDTTLVTLGFLCSKVAFAFLVALNPTLNFLPGTVSDLPISRRAFQDDSSRVDAIVREAISIARDDWDSFETSWDFSTLTLFRAGVRGATAAESYANWRKHSRRNIERMQELEEENNRIFIAAYDLETEVSPEVPDDQITLARADAGDDARRLVSYAVGCMMGRYSLDESGLVYARSEGNGFDPARYHKFKADDDGIIPVTDIEWFDHDAANRSSEFIRCAWSGDTQVENLKWVAGQLGAKANETPIETMRRYFSSQFYKDHLQTYKKRPIYWLFSSGKQKAFECLVYLHRYHEGTLSRMRNEYVTPLFGKLSARIEYLGGDNGDSGQIASASSTAEKNKLRKQLESLKKKQAELKDFDDQLRHYADMRIKLDLDDGVRVNYGKFGNLLAEVRAVTGATAE
jgi:type I restriction-modification system DNA methylase subunit